MAESRSKRGNRAASGAPSSGEPEEGHQGADDVARRTRDTVRATVDDHVAAQSRPGGALYRAGPEGAASSAPSPGDLPPSDEPGDVLLPTAENQPNFSFTPKAGISTVDLFEIFMGYYIGLANPNIDVAKGTLRGLAMPARIFAMLSDQAQRHLTQQAETEPQLVERPQGAAGGAPPHPGAAAPPQ